MRTLGLAVSIAVAWCLACAPGPGGKPNEIGSSGTVGNSQASNDSMHSSNADDDGVSQQDSEASHESASSSCIEGAKRCRSLETMVICRDGAWIESTCPASSECTDEQCECTAPGRTLCGDRCVDMERDQEFCGSKNAGCEASWSCKADEYCHYGDCDPTLPHCREDLEFADPQIHALMRADAGDPEGPLRIEHLSRFGVFALRDFADPRTIESLQGLECLRWLTDFQGGHYALDAPSLDGIGGLPHLDSFELGGLDLEVRGRLEDISGLADSPQLDWLEIIRHSVTAFENLGDMPLLEHIVLEDNKISRVANLKGLTARLSLSLSRNPLADIQALAEIPDLGYLALDETEVTDLAPIAEMSALASLTLRSTPVQQLEPLKGHPALEYLALNDTHVREISALAGMPELSELDLSGTPVKDLHPVLTLPKLERLTTLDMPNIDCIADETMIAELTYELGARGVRWEHDCRTP